MPRLPLLRRTRVRSLHNIAVVAYGRRHITLFPPEQIGNPYIGPPDFAPTAAAISLARLDRADNPRFPRLREALAHATAAGLEPGDALHPPPAWWHHAESPDRLNAPVNCWRQPTPVAALANAPGLDAPMRAILAFRPLPPAERAAWKAVLEHYVFADEDPAAHIPEARRGVLGATDAERIAKLKRLAGRNL